MAGRNQHHIPKSFLKGFASKGRGKWEQIIVARREGQIFSKGIDQVAVGIDFYSGPSVTGMPTLDDAVTNYERRLTGLVAQLRETGIGGVVDAELAAEVVAHLVPRSSSLRDIAQVGITKMLEGAERLVQSPDWIVNSLALEQSKPTELVREQIASALRSFPGIDKVPVPVEILERMAYAMLQENAMQLAQVEMPEVTNLITQLRTEAPEAVQNSHRKSLAENLIQSARRTHLAGLEWRVVAAPPEGAILPDCVALVYTKSEQRWFPLMAADMEDAHTIVMPLAEATLLVGLVRDVIPVDLSQFNSHAAKCSSKFFLSKNRKPELAALASTIGASTGELMDEVVGQAINKTTRRPAVDSDHSSIEPPSSFSSDAKFSLQAPAGMCQADLDSLIVIIRNATSVAASNGGLEKLDGISFTADLSTKIRQIEDLYGQTSASNDFSGTTTVLQYIVDGSVRVHILMQEEFAWGLIEKDEQNSTYALQCFLAELGEAQLVGMLDLAIPGSLVASPDDFHTATLFGITIMFFVAYYRARFCGGAGLESIYEEMARTRLITVLEQRNEDLDALRVAYEDGQDIGPTYQAALGVAARRLFAAASYAGLRAACIKGSQTLDPKVSTALEAAGLDKWLPRFALDMGRIWNRRGRWDSMEELYQLNFHVERMLWQLRIVIWPIDRGQTYVQLLS